MSKDGYEVFCELPDLAEQMGLTEAERLRICKDAFKEERSHVRMEHEIEHEIEERHAAEDVV